MHQAFAQDHLGRLIEPRLRHVEDKQYPGHLGEDAELLDERGHVLARQRIVEWSVPGVEADLLIGCRPYDRDERSGQRQELVALARCPESRGHSHDLGKEAVLGQGVRAPAAI